MFGQKQFVWILTFTDVYYIYKNNTYNLYDKKYTICVPPDSTGMQTIMLNLCCYELALLTPEFFLLGCRFDGDG
jgi:hypothetical protein